MSWNRSTVKIKYLRSAEYEQKDLSMTNLITKADSLRTNAELTRKEVWKSIQKDFEKAFREAFMWAR